MSEPRWVLMPVRLTGQAFERSIQFSEESLNRADAGMHFSNAESAFSWLELLGMPDENATF